MAFKNEGTVDRVLRVIGGAALISLVFVGPETPWGSNLWKVSPITVVSAMSAARCKDSRSFSTSSRSSKGQPWRSTIMCTESASIYFCSLSVRGSEIATRGPAS